jgi:hypothetical protein
MVELGLVKISRHIAKPEHIDGEKNRDGHQVEFEPENGAHWNYLLSENSS